ncbi:MAG: glycogen synthase [bacterium]
MKALFLTNEYPPHVYGGAGIHVDYLTRELAKSIQVEVRCFGDQKEHKNNLLIKGYDYVREMFAACDPKLKSPLSALSRCIDFNADAVDSSVVHCHTWYSHFGGILAKMGYGIPLVITTHSLEPLRPWKREQIGLGYEISSWIERTALNMADALIAVSREMKADIIKLFNVPENKIRVIYNGIDTEEFKPVDSRNILIKYGIDPGIPYVLFVGRVTRQKGIIHLVNAIKYLDKKTQVVLVAGQPDTREIGVEMGEKVAQVQKKRKNVIWIREWVDIKSKIELYSGAAVFCCPSIYEPFGIINLEAMACATPVVGSCVGGIKEIIEHGITGRLVAMEQHSTSPFEPVNPDKFSFDLAQGINEIINDKSMQENMGQASRQRAEKHFSWRTVAGETINLYNSLLSKRNK